MIGGVEVKEHTPSSNEAPAASELVPVAGRQAAIRTSSKAADASQLEGVCVCTTLPPILRPLQRPNGSSPWGEQ